MNGAAIAACLLVAGALPAACQAPAPTPTRAYRARSMSGFRVLVNPEALGHPEASDALKLLSAKLKEITKLVPPDRLAVLRKVRLWVEWNAKPNGAAEFHPSREWLSENGYNTDKAGCVEINNLRNFVSWSADQPMMALHELAHAYHHFALAGKDDAVRAAYEAARTRGIYESVPHVRGDKRRAYCLTNPMEYFAEMSECWFGKNDFYPFTRSELKTHDPEGYALMEQTWGGARPGPR